MQATIKKHQGNWLLELDGKNLLFTEHDEAVIHAYNEGADDFIIKYSSQTSRRFGREGIENFVLKVAA